MQPSYRSTASKIRVSYSTIVQRVLCAAAALTLGLASAAQAQATIRFLDVGQGDAILIQSAGKTALIDTGPTDGITQHLARLGVRALDLLVISHPHADHLGGADAVLEQIPVTNFLDNGIPYTTQSYRRVMQLVQSKHVRYLESTARTLGLGHVKLTILPAPPSTRTDHNLNSQSVAVLVTEGSFHALLSGDSEREEINGWLQAHALSDVDVLKAPHHGSSNGVTPAFLSATRPEVVVISVGAGNTYGHPHARALRYYQTSGRQVLRTDQVGDVIVSVDALGGYRIRTERSAPAAAEASGTAAQGARHSPSCCRTCRKGKACGDSCISRARACHLDKGCACNAGDQR